MKETQFGKWPENDMKKYSKNKLILNKNQDYQNSNESLRDMEKCQIIITSSNDAMYESEEMELIERPFIRGAAKLQGVEESAGPSISNFSTRLSTAIRRSLRLGPKRSTTAKSYKKIKLQEKSIKDVNFFSNK